MGKQGKCPRVADIQTAQETKKIEVEAKNVFLLERLKPLDDGANRGNSIFCMSQSSFPSLLQVKTALHQRPQQQYKDDVANEGNAN